MSINIQQYQNIKNECDAKQVTLVAVSKTKPVEDILELYDLGHRDFGENYVQELTTKYEQLPKDIRWHFIGHLQSNKVKFIAPFIHLIHGVDSEKLLREVNKQAIKSQKIIDCLLQVHIAKEETKFGMDEQEILQVIGSLSQFTGARISGLMGMASFSDDMGLVRNELKTLKSLFNKMSSLTTYHSPLTILSMGMSADYKIAIEEGSTMVRIGSLLFGER